MRAICATFVVAGFFAGCLGLSEPAPDGEPVPADPNPIGVIRDGAHGELLPFEGALAETIMLLTGHAGAMGEPDLGITRRV